LSMTFIACPLARTRARDPLRGPAMMSLFCFRSRALESGWVVTDA
jgi:hypothetical protein